MSLSTRIEKEFLPYINKPGRFLGNEFNAIFKDISNIKLHAVLAFPDIYELGMSYIGFGILYHILNSQPDIWVERVYAPWFDAEEILRKKNIPLFSLESWTPLKDFDWIGFTLQYELSYTNILNMLELGGIPLRSEERNENDPLIIGGGPLACNPEPLAPFFDVFLIGDGEEAILEICSTLKEARAMGWERARILHELAMISGVYIPSFYEAKYNRFGDFQETVPLSNDVPKKIHKRIVSELKDKYYTQKPLVPLIEITHDRLTLEIMRGCTEGCRFCNAGMIYRPLRQRSVDDLIYQSKNAIRSSGFDEISFLSLNPSDYDKLNLLMIKEKLLFSQEKVKFAFPSLRLDAITPEIVDFVGTMKKTGFTFAPEAGSQRLRNVINKNIQEEDLFNTLRLVLDKGWQLVKFYFMIGLPTEKEEDILAIVDLLKKCLEIAKYYKDVRFNVSISPFSPKPHTPFQWEKQESPLQLQKKISLLQEKLRDRRIHLTWRDGEVTSLETIFARGGRELSKVLEIAWESGARFDGWQEGFDWNRWQNAFEQAGIEWKSYLRPLSVSIPLPWDHIDMGISKSFLQQEKIRAYEGQITRDCKDFVCIGCGLQRKEFENFVSCYRKDSKNNKENRQPDWQPLSSINSQPPRTEISYGRGIKKRHVSVAPVKKKIRIRYSKTGQARFISHLDVARIFDRAARRAKISLVYTQGFNPRPKMSFGLPLSLGIASVAEYMDLEAEIGSEIDIQHKINPFLPAGLQILMQKTIYTKVPALAAIINRTTYETFLGDFDLPAEWIEAWLKKKEIVVQRLVKGEKKLINIRPFVSSLVLEEKKLIFQIESIDGRMAKVNEILESLMGEHGVDYRQFLTQRTGQFIVEGNQVFDPFQVV